MEEKRPGQHPDEELSDAAGKGGSAFSPRPSDDKPTAMEQELLRRAQKRADADREEARRTGHGDHQGNTGF